jgi:hypothetical protein
MFHSLELRRAIIAARSMHQRYFSAAGPLPYWPSAPKAQVLIKPGNDGLSLCKVSYGSTMPD